MMRRLLAVLATVLAVASTVSGAEIVRARADSGLTGAQFNAGMIISDADFYNSSAISAAGMQAFLASQYQGCAAGYTCLRDFTTTTSSHPAAPGLCAAYTGAPQQTAAQIFVSVGLACGINPQVLVVLVQKEQGLVLDTSPSQRQYDFAAGQGCPDSSGCDPKYRGFFNQIYYAAYQFKLYQAYPTNYGYVAGRANYIQYNPSTQCGGSNVVIQNQATAGLYDYTPYQPNSAALQNLHGTGDSCSTYGNRNFWVFYNTWFDPPPVPQAAPAQPYDAGGLVGTRADGTLWYYSNNGSSTAPFANQIKIGLGGWQGYDRILTGDIDGDGRADLLATTSDGSLWLYPNNATSVPYLQRTQISTQGWNGFDRIMLADLNNDGLADIVATKPNGTLWEYLNNGNASHPFGSAIEIGLGGWNGFDKITLGDTNNDGRADIVATTPNGSMYLYLNTGNPTQPFGPKSLITSGGWNAFNRIFLADTNNDGLDDLVATQSNGTLWDYQNTGNSSSPFAGGVKIGLGGWQGYTNIAFTQVPVPRRSESADLTAVKSDGTLWSAANDVPPAPYFGRSRIGTGWNSYDLIVSGDVNGDGKPDLVARKPSGSLWLFLGTGNPGSPYGPPTEIGLGGWQQYRQIVATDLTNDGKADLVVTRSDGAMLVYPNTGSLTTPFYPRTQLAAGGWNAYDRIVAGDVTGSGSEELLATKPDGSMWVFGSSGNPAQPFTSGVQLATGGWSAYIHLMLAGPTAPQAGSPADLVATRPDGTLWFFRNTGDPANPFSAGVKIGLGGWTAFTQLLTADLTGADRADLVVTTPDGTLWLYANRGSGPFMPATKIDASTDWRAFDKITSGDVDGDGRPDLIATKPDGTLWYFHNNGNAAQPYDAGVEIGLGGWQNFDKMVAGDVTGDGYADLVVTQPNGTLWLYVNRHSATAPFSGRVEIGLGGWQNFTKLALGDVTGDGLADVVAVGPGGALYLYPNAHNPSAPFGYKIKIGSSGWDSMTNLAVGDVNHDGRADLVSTLANGHLQYYVNTASASTPFLPWVQIAGGWQAFTSVNF